MLPKVSEPHLLDAADDLSGDRLARRRSKRLAGTHDAGALRFTIALSRAAARLKSANWPAPIALKPVWLWIWLSPGASFIWSSLGRETPDVPCSVFFEEAEWKALCTHITKKPVPPTEPPPLRASDAHGCYLGGFLGRKGDGEPGTKSIWLGLQHLDDLAAMWKFMAMNYAPHLLSPPVSRAPT